MPTIDQLAPANAASDADQMLVTQNGVYRRITRSRLLSGFQTEIAAASGTLLGRSSTGTGTVEQIDIGSNLTLTNGVLSADAAPFASNSLPSGMIPSTNDLVSVGQNGADAAVTYNEFMSGLSGLAGTDATKLVIQPGGASAPTTLGNFASVAALTTGAVMTGQLFLASDPTQPLHPASKRYVDAGNANALSKAGGTLTGSLTLAADPVRALDAATKQYVDSQLVAPVGGAAGSVPGPLTLASSSQNTVKNGSLYVGNSDFQHTILSTSGPQTALINKIGSATTDTSVTESYYLVNHSGGAGNVINNLYVGTSVTSTPADGIWGLLSNLTSSSGGGNGGTTGHVAAYIQTVRSAVPNPATSLSGTASGTSIHVLDITNCFTGYAAGVGYPISSTHPLPLLINGNHYDATACIPDTAGATSGPGTLTLRASIAAVDGIAGQSVVGQVHGANLWGGVIEYHEQIDLPSSKSGYGQTLELDWVGNNLDDANTRCFVSAVVGKNNGAGADVEIGNVFGVWPGAGATGTSGASIKRGFQINVAFSEAIIDTRNATQRAGANAVWLADQQTVALSTDGKWTMRFNPSRPGIEFLLNGGVLGSIDTFSRYNAPGGFVTGGTYMNSAALASGQASFDARGASQASGANAIWLNDGHRISFSTDGTHTLNFDSAAGVLVVSGATRFSAPPILPNYAVSALPSSPLPGAKAYATNGRKVGEAASVGTGVEVFADGSGRWLSILSGAQVLA